MIRGTILGTGSYLPKFRLTNAELEKLVDTSDEWIATRTGIRVRHISGPGEETSKIAAQAARQALAMAGISPEELSQIIVGTITPEMTMPSCACLVQKEIGAVNGYAFDLSAACSGFLYALDIADKQVRANPDSKILVIGAETLSSRVNWQDRNTCVLFGDGAGAAVVGSARGERGILAGKLFSDGRLWDLLHMNAAPSQNPFLGGEDGGGVDPSRLGTPRKDSGSYIRMVGREVFKNAVRAMEDAVAQVLREAGVSASDIDLVVPHQANIRILQSLGERLGISQEKIYINIHKYGNTSAATIPIALDDANREGMLHRGDMVLLCAFGGGFTWGAELIRW
ncbi:MAG: ketoacyl-ACP synthase III [Proteobacteria bacterium]|nr:ketoacyl-ACP synthase III [Pseudomonadota bacterium]MBU1688920.1 ketoacyl-ACP synthase III [Pseudomonadota bacterium]